MRHYNPPELAQAMEPYYNELVGFNPIEWLKDERNIALTDGLGSFSLFEYNLPGVYTGHWFFQVRGKEAIRLAEQMLSEIFSDAYDVKVIRGLTPLQNLGARWLAKRMGFTGNGVTQTENGPCELFILTKDQYRSGLKGGL